MDLRRLLSVVCFLVLLFTLTASAVAEVEMDGKFMTMVTKHGEVICRTARQIEIGDRYLNSKNQLFEVYQIDGDQALVKLVKDEKKAEGFFSKLKTTTLQIWNLNLFEARTRNQGPVAIYHTHSDESYAPSDGTSSIRGKGGVQDVGEELKQSLEKNGVPVIHSRASHEPHDAMAYERSRRTAMQLLRRQPSIILDIHRDAVPREEYAHEINGQGVTKLQLVVGRENPNFNATNDFAKQIMRVVNRNHPGFVKGIFYGKGKYNQDLTPRLMLIEFGTNTNHKESARRAAEYFAAAASEIVQGNAGNGIANRGGWRSLFWIIAALIAGVGLFILINRGGLKELSKEFTGAVGENTESKEEEPDNNQDQSQESP